MDFQKAEMLLNITRTAIGYPELRRLHDAAMAELKDLNVDAETHLIDRAAAKISPPKAYATAEEAKKAAETTDDVKRKL